MEDEILSQELKVLEKIRLEGRKTLHEAIMSTSRSFAISRGWSQVRMSEIAKEVGISRQTLYSEVGDKEMLGSQMVLRESTKFLDGIEDILNLYPHDLAMAVKVAVEFTLREAQSNTLLHSIITSARSEDLGLLKSLTSDSSPILRAASKVILSYIEKYHNGLPKDLVFATVDSLIRLTVSHVVLPLDNPEEVGERLSRLTALILYSALDNQR